MSWRAGTEPWVKSWETSVLISTLFLLAGPLFICTVRGWGQMAVVWGSLVLMGTQWRKLRGMLGTGTWVAPGWGPASCSSGLQGAVSIVWCESVQPPRPYSRSHCPEVQEVPIWL